MFDVKNFEINKVEVKVNAKNPLRNLRLLASQKEHLTNIDYGVCEINHQSIPPNILNEILLSDREVQLIDVRDYSEHIEFSIGGINLPVALLKDDPKCLNIIKRI
ncbi:hypothetical protein NQU59_14360 [Acinetobacter colistiniresistens]|uniref:hypothetical protein n=1 Tax=Acinetobacter colistiniresistens TaxID=280145 RepID=UPI00211C77F7|nr:hypothetical protein [Acinetobacter colistiniresistens]UUM26852.1 hypothetical protein NQU59_14360 [Acinetobacter colistiniresistens]